VDDLLASGILGWRVLKGAASVQSGSGRKTGPGGECPENRAESNQRMIIQFLLLAAALTILFFGAEALVRGSASAALRLGLTPLVVGLTVVAFGTSAPELVVSVGAAVDGLGNIAVGNVVGSNIFNIGIILGLAALICPIPVNSAVIKLDAPVMIAAALVMIAVLSGGEVSRLEGFGLVVALAAYTAFKIRAGRALRLRFRLA